MLKAGIDDALKTGIANIMSKKNDQNEDDFQSQDPSKSKRIEQMKL